MRDFEEYELTLADCSKRYEIVDLSQPVEEQVRAFKELHGAVAAWPLRLRPMFESRKDEGLAAWRAAYPLKT